MLLYPWDSPSKNAGVGYHFLLQGIFSGMEPTSLMSPALASGFFTVSATWEAQIHEKVWAEQVSAHKDGNGVSAENPHRAKGACRTVPGTQAQQVLFCFALEPLSIQAAGHTPNQHVTNIPSAPSHVMLRQNTTPQESSPCQIISPESRTSHGIPGQPHMHVF